MGKHEQLVVVFSKNGWDRLTTLISSFLGIQDRKDILDVINGNDAHQEDSKGDHLLHFMNIDSSTREMQLFLGKLMGNINPKEYRVNMIFDDGSEDAYGTYRVNSFNVTVQRQLTWVDANSIHAGAVHVAGPSAPKPVVAAAVNNHTCPTCGNTACSRSEKKCWRCGNPL